MVKLISICPYQTSELPFWLKPKGSSPFSLFLSVVMSFWWLERDEWLERWSERWSERVVPMKRRWRALLWQSIPRICSFAVFVWVLNLWTV